MSPITPQDSDNDGTAAGCIAIFALLTVCLLLAYALTQLDGTW